MLWSKRQPTGKLSPQMAHCGSPAILAIPHLTISRLSTMKKDPLMCCKTNAIRYAVRVRLTSATAKEVGEISRV